MKKSKRSLIVCLVFLFSICCTILIFAQAEDENIQNPPPDASNSGNDEKNPSNQAENQTLSEDQINKIIEDLKSSESGIDVEAKLDEIIKRAELMGNEDLKNYAIAAKNSYKLEKDLEESNATIELLKKKNKNIEGLDDTLKKLAVTEMTVSDLEKSVLPNTYNILKLIPKDNFAKLQDTLVEISDILNKNSSNLTNADKGIISALLLSNAIDSVLFETENLDLANDELSNVIEFLKNYEKQKYLSQTLELFSEKSSEFANSCKKSGPFSPEQVVFINQIFTLKNAPIIYDGHILLALNDIFQYIDATIEYMNNNPTMVITSKDKVLEITGGKNIAYLNDSPINMPVPVLNVNGVIYIPAESFAEVYEIGYQCFENFQTIVFYNNINQ